MKRKIGFIIAIISLFLLEGNSTFAQMGAPADSINSINTTYNPETHFMFGYSYPNSALKIVINGSITAPYYLTGWFRDDGYHTTDNLSFFTGYDGSRYRAFWTFNLTAVSVPITTAVLQFKLFTTTPTVGIGDLVMTSTNRTVSALNTNYTGGMLNQGSGIYQDFGYGIPYGIDQINLTTSGAAINTFQLNDAAISAMNTARGGYFTITLRYDNQFIPYPYPAGSGTLTNRAIKTDKLYLYQPTECDTCTFAVMLNPADNQTYKKQLPVATIPAAGIPISTGTGWETSIRDNHEKWDAAADSNNNPFKYDETGNIIPRQSGKKIVLDGEISTQTIRTGTGIINAIKPIGGDASIEAGEDAGEGAAAVIRGNSMAGFLSFTISMNNNMPNGIPGLAEISLPDIPVGNDFIVFLQPATTGAAHSTIQFVPYTETDGDVSKFFITTPGTIDPGTYTFYYFVITGEPEQYSTGSHVSHH